MSDSFIGLVAYSSKISSIFSTVIPNCNVPRLVQWLSDRLSQTEQIFVYSIRGSIKTCKWTTLKEYLWSFLPVPSRTVHLESRHFKSACKGPLKIKIFEFEIIDPGLGVCACAFYVRKPHSRSGINAESGKVKENNRELFQLVSIYFSLRFSANSERVIELISTFKTIWFDRWKVWLSKTV